MHFALARAEIANSFLWRRCKRRLREIRRNTSVYGCMQPRMSNDAAAGALMLCLCVLLLCSRAETLCLCAESDNAIWD